MNRQNLIDCFQDTLQRARTGVLMERTWIAQASSVIYEPGFRTEKLYRLSQTEIRVEGKSSLAAAKEHLGCGRTAVLNFANPHYPGGGVTRGDMAQEECLCRSSNLYICLSDGRVFEDFYQYHRSKTGHDFSDRLIYTRDVTVFKDDQPCPEMLPPEDWFQVDVISCAAPYLAKRPYVNSKVLLQTLCGRIRNVLEAAMDREVRVLILGAFGCGAFGNPPEIVAKAFRLVLQEQRYHGAFSRVVFAMGAGAEQNLAAFEMEFLGTCSKTLASEVPGLRDIRLPGGKICVQGSGSEAFLRWQAGNPYYGKQFSILGDSVSTLEGFQPRGYAVYYAGERGEKAGVTAMESTWWGKTIRFFGGELLVNGSWSGSRVARLPEAQEQFPSGCSDLRTGSLHVGAVKPDVILVAMGVNDLIFGTPPLPPEELELHSADTCFSLAYGLMLNKLRANYPQAEIWCLTLPETCVQENGDSAFRGNGPCGSIREYNRQIVNGAMAYDCRVADLYEMGIPVDTMDGVHPTARGMETTAVSLVRQMADREGAGLLDCPQEHEIRDGICCRCGKRIEVQDRQPEKLRLRLASGEILTASGWQVTLGRNRENDIVLENPYVARAQATFTCRQGQWFLRDHDTRNGTYLNGVRLEQDGEYPLQAGDVISFARKEEAVFLN